MIASGIRKPSIMYRDLETSLLLLCEDEPTGEWRFSWGSSPDSRTSRHVFLSGGRVIYLGRGRLTGAVFVELLRRYVPKLKERVVSGIPLGKALSTADLDWLVVEFLPANGLSFPDVLKALRVAVLAELDSLPLKESGQQIELGLNREFPPLRFSDRLETIKGLLSEVSKRQLLWRKLQSKVPSMELVPVLNSDAIARSSLSQMQKKRLGSLVRSGKTLAEIAVSTSKDQLEIARVFSQFAESGLVTLKGRFSGVSRLAGSRSPGLPIVIVDDSPVLVKQFQGLVEHWGYRARAVLDANQAISTIREIKPVMAFIDVNMPDISGFELVKQIRCCPELADIPLTILTAEKKLSNKWQAKWSGCNFLTKPLALEEVSRFTADLQAILRECASLKA